MGVCLDAHLEGLVAEGVNIEGGRVRLHCPLPVLLRLEHLRPMQRTLHRSVCAIQHVGTSQMRRFVSCYVQVVEMLEAGNEAASHSQTSTLTCETPQETARAHLPPQQQDRCCVADSLPHLRLLLLTPSPRTSALRLHRQSRSDVAAGNRVLVTLRSCSANL